MKYGDTKGLPNTYKAITEFAVRIPREVRVRQGFRRLTLFIKHIIQTRRHRASLKKGPSSILPESAILRLQQELENNRKLRSEARRAAGCVKRDSVPLVVVPRLWGQRIVQAEKKPKVTGSYRRTFWHNGRPYRNYKSTRRVEVPVAWLVPRLAKIRNKEAANRT